MDWWHWIVGKFSAGPVTGAGGGDVATGLSPQADDGAVETLEPSAERSGDSATSGGEIQWWRPPGVTNAAPVQLEPSNLSHEARAFENLLISHFDGHDLTMPTMSKLLEQALTLLRDQNCDFTTLAELIGEDQVTAAAVLRTVNSPYYRGADNITTLKPAITRLGAKALHTLIMHQTMRAGTMSVRGADPRFAELVWRNSLAGACIMRGLAKLVRLSPEDASLIGLLHDIGNVIVLRITQKEQVAGRFAPDMETFEMFCHECHQEFGELVADAWKLPDRLRALICDHHRPPEDDDPLRTERLTIQLADMINSMIGYGPAAQYDLLSTDCVQQLGLADRPDFIEYLKALPGDLEENVVCV